VEGIERIQGRINDIESRIAAIQQLVASRNNVGWGPGLSGVGQAGPYGSTTAGYTTASATIDALGGSNDLLSKLDVTQSTSFARTLAQLRGTDTATSSASASGVPSGEIPAFTPPASLVAYGNGRIPLDALAPIGVGTHRLWTPAAASFKRMAADAASQGVKIGVTDSYRSYDQQVQLAQKKGLYAEGGVAAQPGQSKHGWGVALDMDVDNRGLAWLRANGSRYGFYETTPREPWHWEYRAS
jgi:hypothetical protein